LKKVFVFLTLLKIEFLQGFEKPIFGLKNRFPEIIRIFKKSKNDDEKKAYVKQPSTVISAVLFSFW